MARFVFSLVSHFRNSGRRSRTTRLAAFGVIGTLAACQPGANGGEFANVANADADAQAGRIAGEALTVGDVDDWIKEKLFDNATGERDPLRVFELRRRSLLQMAAEQALEAEAQRRGIDPADLVHQEIDERVSVSEEETRAFYDEHRESFGQRSFEQAKPVIERQLTAKKRQEIAEEFRARLREQVGFESFLEPPRFEIAGDGPSRGPAEAPITLVEFCDYQNPFCQLMETVVAEALERYPEQVRFVYRHFPLDERHPQARTAAIAAMCAGEQDKFWPYHEQLFEHAPAFPEDRLRAHAQAVGLDTAAFGTCLEERRYAEQVEADVEAGRKANVTGTPAFFVNGRPVGNVRRADELATAIDEELERLGLPIPSAQETAALDAPDASTERAGESGAEKVLSAEEGTRTESSLEGTE